MSPVTTWKIKRHAEGKDSDCSPKLETFSSYEKRSRTQEQRELGARVEPPEKSGNSAPRTHTQTWLIGDQQGGHAPGCLFLATAPSERSLHVCSHKVGQTGTSQDPWQLTSTGRSPGEQDTAAFETSWSNPVPHVTGQKAACALCQVTLDPLWTSTPRLFIAHLAIRKEWWAMSLGVSFYLFIFWSVWV